MISDNQTSIDSAELDYHLMHYSAISFKTAFDQMVQLSNKETSQNISGYYILPILFSGGQSIECYLKAFLMSKGFTKTDLKKKFSHKLENLHSSCIENKLYIPILPRGSMDEKNFQCNYENEQDSANRAKTKIESMVATMSVLHSGDDDFANRYLKSRKDGYPASYDMIATGLQELELQIRPHLGYPPIQMKQKP